MLLQTQVIVNRYIMQRMDILVGIEMVSGIIKSRSHLLKLLQVLWLMVG